MEDARRRAYIKQQAAKKKQEEGQPSKGTGLANPSTKRKLLKKSNRLPKKPKTTFEPIVGLKADAKKTVTPVGQGRGKGFMKGPATVSEKPPVLLHEDSKYVLENLSYIITSDDYKNLSNHATEAMGETRLFSIAQVTMPVHFLSFLSFHLPRH